MITIVLNYNNGKTYLINHHIDDNIEKILFKEYDFKESEIEWMTVDKLEIETLQ